MKKFKFNKILIVTVLTIALVLGFTPPIPVHAATSPSLGTADSFSILAGTPNITNVPTSSISGDVGLSPATGAGIGLTDLEVAGTIYAVDAAGPAGSVENAALLTTAKSDLSDAFDALAEDACGNGATDGDGSDGSIPGITWTGTIDLAGKTLVPGIYCAGAFQITTGEALTLDGMLGSDVWIFRSAATLITTGGVDANVVFPDGSAASSCNVWWRVVSSATIGTYTNFIGNILAYASIGMETLATLDGRALAETGAVTLDSNTIFGTCATPATTLKLVKAVTNDNGGTTLNTAWTLTATGTTGGFSDNGGTGIFHTVTAGVEYLLSESPIIAQYTAGSWSCDGGSLSDSTITLSSGQNVTCTITNTYIPPVVSHSGGGGYILPPVAFVLLPSINIISTPVVIAPIIPVVPKLPKTGFPPEERSAVLPVVLLSGLSLFSIFLYFAQKKQTT